MMKAEFSSSLMFLLKLRIENSAVFHLEYASGKYFKALNVEVYYNVFFFLIHNEWIWSYGGDFPSQNGCDDWNLNLKRATEVKPCELLRAFKGQFSLTLKIHWEQRTLESSSFGLNSLTSPALIFDDPGTNLMLSEGFFFRGIFFIL